MINKLYENVKNYIKANYVFLLLIISTVIIFNVNTGYSIYKPGGIIDITNRINVNEQSVIQKGSLNMAYVGMVDGKLPFYLIAKLLPSWDLVKNTDLVYSENETIEEARKRDHIYYNESISTAKYLAYLKSNTPFDLAKEINYIVYISEKSTADVQIGDIILEYDSIPYTNLRTLKEYISGKMLGDEINLLIERDGKQITTQATVYIEEEVKLIGLSAATIYELSSDTKVTIDSKATESGPSGGLMLTLAIYNALITEDITKGNKIVGTGTIDADGNVGAIGGVEYKLAGAVKAGADIFLVPIKNYDAAIKYANDKKYDIIIQGVSTFDEALEILNAMEEKE